jgi:hypothetical protein
MNEDLFICVQCESPFEVTAKEFDNYLKRGFDPPTRCPICRKNKHKQINGSDSRHPKYKREHPQKWHEDRMERKHKLSCKNRSSKRIDW